MSHEIATSRYASYSLSSTDSNVLDTLPDLFKFVDVKMDKENGSTPSGLPSFTFNWTFHEMDWTLWPDFCDWANIQPALRRRTSFEWPLVNALAEKQHNVLLFSPGTWDAAQTIAANIWSIKYCDRCANQKKGAQKILHIGLRENPSLTIRINSTTDKYPHIFAMPDTYGAMIISSELFSALKAAGLATGLATLPVEISDRAPQDFLCIYPIVDVGGRIGPYGFLDACPFCTGLSPKFGFFPTFTRPPEDCHFAASYPNVDRFLISGKVWTWLENEGKKWSGNQPEGRNDPKVPWMRYDIAGWYPAEKQQAFFPEAFQATSY